MGIVEQYVKLNDAISELEDQALALRQDLLRGGDRLRNDQYEVVIRSEIARVFRTELLPPEILNDPRFWETASRQEVDVRPLLGSPAFVRPETPVQVDLLRYRC